MKTELKKAATLNYTNGQVTALVILRMLIGWHLLYEGVVKLYNPSWSAGPFLMDSKGIFSQFFFDLASNPAVLNVVDFLNVWGLIAIGLGLILGLFNKVAAIAGAILLSLYYLSHPPFIGLKYALPSEGSYLIVNKNLIEIFALIVLAVFPTGLQIGLDRLIALSRGKSAEPVENEELEKEAA